MKEDKIQNLQRNCIGAPDERLEENEILISELQDQIDLLEKQCFTLKQEAKGFGMSAPKAKSKDESEKMLNDITK